jgi:DNA-directed RNA polymerase specialized sigma24 family protein
MDDREIVSAMRASALATLAGLAAAYDKYAAPLYGYCCWVLGEPDAAAEVVRDTFLLAMTDLRGIRDPDQLRPHLYAVARDECRQRSGSSQRPPVPRRRPGLRGLIGDTLATLDDGEREVVELIFRHGLSHADLALVLGVPRRRASALGTQLQSHLEDSLAVAIVAYTGAQACAELNELLPGWDGRLTLWTTGMIENHIEECLTCKSLRYQAFQPAIVYALEPPAELPANLRGQVIGRLVDSPGPEGIARGDASAPPRSQAGRGALLALAAVTLWLAAAVSVTLLTILGRPALFHLSPAPPARHPRTAARAGAAGQRPAPEPRHHYDEQGGLA